MYRLKLAGAVPRPVRIYAPPLNPNCNGRAPLLSLPATMYPDTGAPRSSHSLLPTEATGVVSEWTASASTSQLHFDTIKFAQYILYAYTLYSFAITHHDSQQQTDIEFQVCHFISSTFTVTSTSHSSITDAPFLVDTARLDPRPPNMTGFVAQPLDSAGAVGGWFKKPFVDGEDDDDALVVMSGATRRGNTTYIFGSETELRVSAYRAWQRIAMCRAGTTSWLQGAEQRGGGPSRPQDRDQHVQSKIGIVR
ncbi:hypothetical protein CCM_01553 [Cordyceps militaris CM01]|uniref:Uncharacterized protein n=1 Tax=Cordyceps militaris (strain CM01) TaxID=983644 RepID=G3J5N9_CORMM|nr:uncharacterized protein CCM_01553 [Cordyceps militaris CM01]EGX96895.1 hypothetical protein CCM_01553 [Cordyceps militaris CM01]